MALQSGEAVFTFKGTAASGQDFWLDCRSKVESYLGPSWGFDKVVIEQPAGGKFTLRMEVTIYG